jgi:hypothetical protein
MTDSMHDRTIELAGSKEMGPCECCGTDTRRVWGYVHRGMEPEAAYFVEWTLGKVDGHGAHFDLIVGQWGDGTGPSDKVAVSLEFRRTERGPEFMVIDAGSRRIAENELAGRALSRAEVIGTPLAQDVFGIVDAIWLRDGRISEVTGAAEQ